MMPTLPNDKQLRFKVNYRLIMSEYTAIPDSVILTRSELEQRDRKMIADAIREVLNKLWERFDNAKDYAPANHILTRLNQLDKGENFWDGMAV